MNLSSQRYRTQNTWPDRLQPDRRGRHCGTHSVGVTPCNRALGGRRSIHHGPFNLLVRQEAHTADTMQ
jgi:hypothetical protein